jgi:hypothetical protein
LEMVSQNKEGIPSDQQMWIVAEKNWVAGRGIPQDSWHC